MSALSHAQIWEAIDALALRLDMTPSALARLAGLDATSFNRSKRQSTEQPPRLRWPSTESLAKLLRATGVSFSEFAVLAQGGMGVCHMPVLGFAQAAQPDHFDAVGYPVGSGWDWAAFTGVVDGGVYALEITGQGLEPVYRNGDRIVVSPALEARSGDRVLVKMVGGEVMAKQVAQVTAKRLDLVSLDSAGRRCSLPLSDVAWVSRIIWASQ